MRSHWTRLATSLSLALSLMFVVGACDKTEGAAAPAASEAPAEAPTEAEAKPAAAKVDDKTAALLAQADAKDGKTDKLVSQCAACKLSMDGKAEHSCEIGEYTLHSCSAGCAEKVKADPAKVLTAALAK